MVPQPLTEHRMNKTENGVYLREVIESPHPRLLISSGMEAYIGSHRITVAEEQQDQNFVIRYFDAATALQVFALERVTSSKHRQFKVVHSCSLFKPPKVFFIKTNSRKR
jgi:hypothetical protein